MDPHREKYHFFSYDNVARVRQYLNGGRREDGDAMKKKSPLVIKYCGGGVRHENNERASALTNKQQRKNGGRCRRK